jgi:hypothetical protein
MIRDLDSVNNYDIDAAEGHTVTIQNNVIEQGPKSSNYTIVGYALDGAINPVAFHMYNNYVVNDRNLTVPDWSANDPFIWWQQLPPTRDVSGNTFVGPGTFSNGGGMVNNEGRAPYAGNNTFVVDRTTAGIGAYPNLPPIMTNCGTSYPAPF